MILDYTDEFVVRGLPAFFLDYGGPAIFKEMNNEIKICLPNLTKYFTNIILQAAQKDLLLVAVENDKIVGFSYADASLNDTYKLNKPVISGAFTYVLPDYRRKGIATELRERLLDRIKDKGYKVVFCQINKNNQASNSSMKVFFDKIKHERFDGYRGELL